MACLGLDKLVERLTGREDLARGVGGIELRGVAANRLHLPQKMLLLQANDEGGLYGVLPVAECVQQLVRSVSRRLPGAVAGQAGEEAGVASQLGGHPVVRVSSAVEGKDHDPGAQAADHGRYLLAAIRAVDHARVRKARVPAHGQPQHLGGSIGLLCPHLRRAAGAHLALREVDRAGAVSLLHAPEEGPAAGELDVVPVGVDR